MGSLAKMASTKTGEGAEGEAKRGRMTSEELALSLCRNAELKNAWRSGGGRKASSRCYRRKSSAAAKVGAKAA
jgi:hypothetical protein